MPTTIGAGAQGAAAEAYATFYATGQLRIYDGAVPANAKAALSSNTLCATHTLAGFVVSGDTLTANGIASSTILASSSGGVTFGRIYIGSVCEWQGVVGSELTVTPTADYVVNGISSVTGLALTVPDS